MRAAHQQPALVVVARGAADVMAAVRFACEGGLGVGVMATGHGVGTACDGGVLINTSNMRGVRVDPVDKTARVEAGALWVDLIHESQVRTAWAASWAPPRTSALSARPWAAASGGSGASMASTPRA